MAIDNAQVNPEVGRTRDVGFEIGVSRTFDCEIDHAWSVLTGTGVPHWLGALPGALPTEPGATGRTDMGVGFEIRSYHPLDRIRLVVTRSAEAVESTVQITVRAAGPDRTRVNFHQERLRDGAERSAQREHWKLVLDALRPLFNG